MVVTLATFATYVTIDPINNTITAEKIFGTVALFNVVRIPMNQFPRIVMETVKLMVSIKRIDRFLSCPDLEDQTVAASVRPEDSSRDLAHLVILILTMLLT